MENKKDLRSIRMSLLAADKIPFTITSDLIPVRVPDFIKNSDGSKGIPEANKGALVLGHSAPFKKRFKTWDESLNEGKGGFEFTEWEDVPSKKAMENLKDDPKAQELLKKKEEDTIYDEFVPRFIATVKFPEKLPVAFTKQDGGKKIVSYKLLDEVNVEFTRTTGEWFLDLKNTLDSKAVELLDLNSDMSEEQKHKLLEAMSLASGVYLIEWLVTPDEARASNTFAKYQEPKQLSAKKDETTGKSEVDMYCKTLLEKHPDGVEAGSQAQGQSANDIDIDGLPF